MRSTSVHTRKAFAVTGVLDRILKEAIYPHHFLTAWQVLRVLNHRQGTLTTIQDRLKKLTDAKYLHSFYLPLPAKQRPFVYALGLYGKKYLRATDLDTAIYYLPSEQEEKSYGFLMHQLELNDIIISARLLEKSLPQIYLFDWYHDLQLKRQPFETVDEKGKLVRAIPDALFDFRVRREGKKDARFFLWLEHDRGEESNEKFRKKLRDIMRVIEQGVHTERFGAQRVIIMVTTSAGERRVEKMRMLARLELGKVAENSPRNQMFKFASVPRLMAREPIDPRMLFCDGDIWLSPLADVGKPSRLIDLRLV